MMQDIKHACNILQEGKAITGSCDDLPKPPWPCRPLSCSGQSSPAQGPGGQGEDAEEAGGDGDSGDRSHLNAEDSGGKVILGGGQTMIRKNVGRGKGYSLFQYSCECALNINNVIT